MSARCCKICNFSSLHHKQLAWHWLCITRGYLRNTKWHWLCTTRGYRRNTKWHWLCITRGYLRNTKWHWLCIKKGTVATPSDTDCASQRVPSQHQVTLTVHHKRVTSQHQMTLTVHHKGYRRNTKWHWLCITKVPSQHQVTLTVHHKGSVATLAPRNFNNYRPHLAPLCTDQKASNTCKYRV